MMKNKIEPLNPIRSGGPAEKAYIKAVKAGWNILPKNTKTKDTKTKQVEIFSNKKEMLEYATKTMLKAQKELASIDKKVPNNYHFPPKS